MSVFGKFRTGARQDSEHWMGVSDLMAGLMMVFLFISVTFMRYVLVEKERIQEIASLISGEKITQSGKDRAKEILELN